MSNGTSSAHTDTFARDRLPPAETWPDLKLDDPAFRLPGRLNCAAWLLDEAIGRGYGDRPVLRTYAETWTYRDLLDRANRIARVLTEDLGLQPGNRVLIRSANNPMFVACWLAIAKAGGIVVATMPLLRAGELSAILDAAEVSHALCDQRLVGELTEAVHNGSPCQVQATFDGSGEPGAGGTLETMMVGKPGTFETVDTAADDVVLIAFTSGTTGRPKGTMHFHRDIVFSTEAVTRSVLDVSSDDVFIGSPPLAFTFGLGGLVLFPMHVGASTVMLERPIPAQLLEAITAFRATVCWTAPTAYRAMLDTMGDEGVPDLRLCVSSGEALPRPTAEAWTAATGIDLINALGSTEMLHMFIASAGTGAPSGALGKPILGYEAMIVDADMRSTPTGTVGRLAVRGPTGCRYLNDPRQSEYVRDGWNLTGDACWVDEQGVFWFRSRADDLIVSAGYNIAGPEVEDALLAHEAVAECAVIGTPDAERGNVVHAFIRLRNGWARSDETARRLQDHVKSSIAPYKYPRRISFVDTLPKTETGKIQRFKLRDAPYAPAIP